MFSKNLPFVFFAILFFVLGRTQNPKPKHSLLRLQGGRPQGECPIVPRHVSPVSSTVGQTTTSYQGLGWALCRTLRRRLSFLIRLLSATGYYAGSDTSHHAVCQLGGGKGNKTASLFN
eukprot:GHVT01065717.1.p1 GENE.GHVT01065717.1~~GHVT01065717.1.p1  ORF type:complete len:118 (+),score=4.00 GHVT01065717.1:313-666(+)